MSLHPEALDDDARIELAQRLLAENARHDALVAEAADLRADASAEDDPAEALALLKDARACEAAAMAIREGRA